MCKKWISLLLAAVMALGVAGPAMAEEGQEAPPQAEIIDGSAAPAPQEGGEEAAPAEEEATGQDVPAAISADVPETVSVGAALPTGGIAVTINGPLDTIRALGFYAPGGGMYENPYDVYPDGVYYWNDPDQDGLGERVKVSDQFTGQFCVYPGTELILETEPEYDAAVSGGDVVRNSFYLDHSTETLDIDERIVNIIAPASGSVTITLQKSGKALPRQIPLTMYGGGLGGGFESAQVSDEKSFGSWYFESGENGVDRGAIFTGTKLSFELKKGYTIEVLKGGRVTRIGGYFYPTTITDAVGVDLQVDDDAEEFVFAIVKQGEHFTVPETAKTQTAGEAAPAPASAEGVTVNLTGALEGLDEVLFENTDNDEFYHATSSGIWWDELPEVVTTPDKAVIHHVVQAASSLPTQLVVRPGGEVRFWTQGEYGITLDNGTTIDDETHSWYGGGDSARNLRCITVTAPNSGTMNVSVYKDGAEVAQVVPYTFYNEDWENGIVVGGGDVSASVTGYKALADGTQQRVITTGGDISVWMAPGYAIEVLKGGYVAKTEAPSGPAAAGVPAGTTDYVLHVDLEAEEFVIAAVKQGEHFQLPDEPGTEAGTGSGRFTDVSAGVWYAEPVEKAYSSGIVKGVTDSTFAPNGTTTRGQTVTMLYRAMGSPGGANVFSDTSGEVGSAAGWASASGVTNGVSATAFAPEASITREQLVTMLYRLAGSPAADTAVLGSYTDGGSVQGYARSAVAWALGKGLLTGYGDGTIRPAATATRAEVCALIVRYLGA